MEKHFIPNTEGVIFANKKKFSFSIDSILLSHFSKVKKDVFGQTYEEVR